MSGEAIRQRVSLPAAAIAEPSQLVRLARIGMGVAHEEEQHRVENSPALEKRPRDRVRR